MTEEDIRRDERTRIAKVLRRYFEDGTSTFRGLNDYLDLGYAESMAEGWLDFNNAVVDFETRAEERTKQ